MKTDLLYVKAFSSNLKDDWDNYKAALKAECNQRLPILRIDNKDGDRQDEWEGMSEGLELNPYAAHWWGW